MLSVRVNTFNDFGFGEPEQDANAALTELDKGLRSSKVGDQCEAIVRFPNLFEKYPFPILINASLLKLADVFRVGNNFLRLCILKVCQQSNKHLDKISTVDEFMRRIYGVIHSNDPIARAITLRTLGAVAVIIPERQQVHHSIRSSLDSHDHVEVLAAIWAAVQFAAQSKTFAVSMCNKVSNMIEGQSTPADMKLRLIPILQYMYHDTHTTALVRTLCLHLLPTYPAQDFVMVILKTLTKLAVATLVDIPGQVTLLLRYLRDDPRSKIKVICLQYLLELAKPGSHFWSNAAVDDLIAFALSTTNPMVLTMVYDILQVLTKTLHMCNNYYHNESKLWELCSRDCYAVDAKVAVQAITILTQLLCYSFKANLPPKGAPFVISVLETLILLLTLEDTKQLQQLKRTLKCVVYLCEANHAYCDTFIELLFTKLTTTQSQYSVVMCESVCVIGSIRPDTLMHLLARILKLLSSLNEVKVSDNEQPNPASAKYKIMLCTIVFQSMTGSQWTDDMHRAIMKAAKSASLDNYWPTYCIGREALRYSHHELGYKLFDQLTEQVSSEHFHFWLVSLREVSLAETLLSGSRVGTIKTDDTCQITQLQQALVHYNKAVTALKAATSPSFNLHFQIEYIRIRCQFLQCLLRTLCTCNVLYIVPPPAVANTVAQSTKDELQRYGYITGQLRKCVKEFAVCVTLYSKLYQKAFDADVPTLNNIQIMKNLCALIEMSIDSLCSNNSYARNPDFSSILITQTESLETQQLLKACRNIVKLSEHMNQEPLAITRRQIDVLKRIVKLVTSASLPVPRYFFQQLQSTSLKLAISPQPRVMGESISVQSNCHLAVKVEGVIQHGLRPGLFRSIEQILITVTYSPIDNQLDNSATFDYSGFVSGASLGSNATPNNAVSLNQTVTPHKDFFSAQFLLVFPKGGQYTVNVEASVIDDVGNSWCTGPKSTLTVKVAEEAKLAPISMPVMTTSSNVILMPEDSLFLRSHQKK